MAHWDCGEHVVDKFAGLSVCRGTKSSNGLDASETDQAGATLRIDAISRFRCPAG